MAKQMSYRTDTTGTTQSSVLQRTAAHISTGMLTGALLLLAGWGWDNGQFVQPVQSSWGPLADSLHLVPVVALVLLTLAYVRGVMAGRSVRGAVIGVSIVSIISIVGCIVMLILGATNPDPNSVGVHTLEDALPVIVMNLGSLFWFASLLVRRTMV